MEYLTKQNQKQSFKMKRLEVKRNQEFLITKFKKTQEEPLKKKIDKQNEFLREYREDNVVDRWVSHSEWEIRKYGIIVSNEEEWKKRFVEEGETRPKKKF